MKIKFIHLFLFILCFSTGFTFAQSLREQTERAKYKMDNESKFLGDTLMVKQIIKDIELAVNNFNTDEIINYFIDKREKINKRKDLIKEKREMFSNLSMVSDSTRRIDKNHENIFKISNINLAVNDTVICAQLDIQINGVVKTNEDIGLQQSEDNSEYNIVNDKWVFKKILGQWKIVSCDNFIKMFK